MRCRAYRGVSKAATTVKTPLGATSDIVNPAGCGAGGLIPWETVAIASLCAGTTRRGRNRGGELK